MSGQKWKATDLPVRTLTINSNSDNQRCVGLPLARHHRNEATPMPLKAPSMAKKNRKFWLNMIGASGQPDFRKVVAARRQMMHVQDDQGAQLYPRKTAAPVILPP